MSSNLQKPLEWGYNGYLLAQLKALTINATSGEWVARKVTTPSGARDGLITIIAKTKEPIAYLSPIPNEDANAAFISTMNPLTVLALLNRLEYLEKLYENSAA